MAQQMRFGGNIGVHAINRTSAAPLNNPTQQLMQPPGGMLGGQGMGSMGNLGALGGLSAMNNPLAGLPGAPRPAIRPPNWQRTQALAQQAAQAQAQQQVSVPSCNYQHSAYAVPAQYWKGYGWMIVSNALSGFPVA